MSLEDLAAGARVEHPEPSRAVPKHPDPAFALLSAERVEQDALGRAAAGSLIVGAVTEAFRGRMPREEFDALVSDAWTQIGDCIATVRVKAAEVIARQTGGGR